MKVRITDKIKNISGRMDNLFDVIETGTMDANVAGPRLNSLAKEKETFEARLFMK